MKHKNRKQLRIQNYDYSQEGYYYITICTKNKKNILSKISVGADASVRPKSEMQNKTIGTKEYNIQLTQIGKIVEESLININKIYKNGYLDEYIIMPNHIHVIIKIEGRTEASAPTKNNTRI